MTTTTIPRTRAFPDPPTASNSLAAEVAALIQSRDADHQSTVLGLATGATPTLFYKELRRLHSEEGLSFKNVITFNLDEYVGLGHRDSQSYWRFMHDHLFDHIDIAPENIHIPNGAISESKLTQYCLDYEAAIQKAGGIDLQILGIGTTGHIGFNEPGTPPDSHTAVVELTEETRRNNAVFFNDLSDVPTHAISMGCGTILDAKQIALMAWGEKKAPVILRSLRGPVTTDCPASFLQEHPHVTSYLDEAAASELG